VNVSLRAVSACACMRCECIWCLGLLSVYVTLVYAAHAGDANVLVRCAHELPAFLRMNMFRQQIKKESKRVVCYDQNFVLQKGLQCYDIDVRLAATAINVHGKIAAAYEFLDRTKPSPLTTDQRERLLEAISTYMQVRVWGRLNVLRFWVFRVSSLGASCTRDDYRVNV